MKRYKGKKITTKYKETIETYIYDTHVTISKENILIDKTHFASTRKNMLRLLEILREYIEDSGITMSTPLDYRSNNSLLREWVTYNNVYKFKKEKIKSYNFKCTQKWYMKVICFVGSLIVL